MQRSFVQQEKDQKITNSTYLSGFNPFNFTITILINRAEEALQIPLQSFVSMACCFPKGDQ
jgi:hypothetical protein